MGIILVFKPHRLYKKSNDNLLAGTIKSRGWENLRFSAEIAVYLGNGARQALGYCVTISHR